MDSKFATLVFRADTDEQINKIREAAKSENCRAWSLDHDLLRLELIRDALERSDIQRAIKYLDADGVFEFRNDLMAH